MWVYPSDEVRTSPETTALLPQLPAESGTPKQSVPEPLNAGEAMPDGVAQQPERLHRRMRHASRDCCLLAAAFLLGTAAAGSLQAVCDASQQEMLSYFLQCWCGLFSISAPTSAAVLLHRTCTGSRRHRRPECPAATKRGCFSRLPPPAAARIKGRCQGRTAS